MTAPVSSDRVRRFVVEGGAPLAPEGSHRYTSVEEARGVPVAEAVLGVPGISEVIVEGHALMALRHSAADWADLEEAVQYAMELAVTGDAPADAQAPPLDDDKIFEVTGRLLEREINPAVAGHGGKVELVDVQDGVAVMRMMGGCQGCGMANVTLRQGIERQLKRAVPGFRGIQDITDHAAGTNPYFHA